MNVLLHEVHVCCLGQLFGPEYGCISSLVNSALLFSDDNECISGTHNCNTSAACTNTAGSFPFTCTCNAGFSGDGFSCAGNYEPFLILLLSTVLNKQECLILAEIKCYCITTQTWISGCCLYMQVQVYKAILLLYVFTIFRKLHFKG